MTTSGSASPSAPPMPATSPFDVLAEEFGAVAGRIERESGLRVTAAIADLGRKFAEQDLLLTKLLQDVNERVNARLATVRDGVDGRDGAAGRDGVDGAPGRDGIDGKDGRDGADGVQGPAGGTGPAGERGLAGEPGKDGLPAERGADGLPGVQGERGMPGPAGPAGKLPVVKAWTEGVHYEGDVRLHGGATYQALRDTGKEPGASEDWVCIAARGADGRGFTIRGTYSSDNNFFANDVVACNGGSFVALKDGAGACPGPDWQLIAGPGKRGDKGQPGERGLRGEQGQPGATIARWSIDPKQYTATPIMSDGTQGPAVEMRDIFEQFIIETR
jgi:hypothetical protein